MSTSTPVFDQDTAASTPPRNADSGATWQRIRRNWWLVAITAVFAIVLGLAAASRGADGSVAEAQVNLGQPLSPNGSQLGIAESQMNTALGLVNSREYVRAAADAVGIPASNLRRGLRVRQLEAPVASKLAQQAQIVVIEVELVDAENAEKAVQHLADQLVADTNEYANAKETVIEERLAAAQKSLKRQTEFQEEAQAQLGSSSADTFPAWAIASQTAQTAVTEAETDVIDYETELNLLRNIEKSRIVAGPESEPAEQASPWATIVVSGTLGAIVGLGLAVVWRPRSGR